MSNERVTNKTSDKFSLFIWVGRRGLVGLYTTHGTKGRGFESPPQRFLLKNVSFGSRRRWRAGAGRRRSRTCNTRRTGTTARAFESGAAKRKAYKQAEKENASAFEQGCHESPFRTILPDILFCIFFPLLNWIRFYFISKSLIYNECYLAHSKTIQIPAIKVIKDNLFVLSRNLIM